VFDDTRHTLQGDEGIVVHDLEDDVGALLGVPAVDLALYPRHVAISSRRVGHEVVAVRA
jgi:hypothetical protein